MSATICFFNANNLFLRYKWGKKYPGDISGKSYVSSPKWGYLPAYNSGSFKPFRPVQTAISAATVISEDYPDILCMCEVESILALRSFNESYLNNHYEYAYLVDSRDYRQIDVCILSNKEILGIRSHVDDRDKNGNFIFSRDCLEVNVALNKSGSKRITLFINHLKLKFVDKRNKSADEIEKEIKAANLRRLSQSNYVRELVKSRFPDTEFSNGNFVVLGDFNDQPDSQWVEPLTKDANLFNVLDLLPEEERWTYWWKSRNRVSQIDYFLLSPSLSEKVVQENIKPRVERRGIGFKRILENDEIRPKTTRVFKTDEDPHPLGINFGFQRFSTVLNPKQHASDHCPIFLELPI